MTISNGDKMPSGSFKVMTSDGVKDMSTADLFAGKKVALFSVPGAFTPTCSNQHLPSYLKNFDAIKAKGFDTIACMAVNDAFVMSAWGKSQNAEALVMAADGNGEFTTAMGLTLDGSGFGLGHRSSRYALIAEDGKITTLNAEQGGAFEVSSAEKIIEAL